MQISVYDFDNRGVSHPVVPLSYRLAILVESSIHGLYETFSAEKGEINDDFSDFFGSGIFGMAQLVVRVPGSI